MKKSIYRVNKFNAYILYPVKHSGCKLDLKIIKIFIFYFSFIFPLGRFSSFLGIVKCSDLKHWNIWYKVFYSDDINLVELTSANKHYCVMFIGNVSESEQHHCSRKTGLR